MTLGLAIVTHKFASIVSDRRITGAGLTPNDEFDKICYLATLDARVAISFTGLAEHRRYNSKVKLIETLVACVQPDLILFETIKRMTTTLNKEFLPHPDIRAIRPADRRFTLIVVGFRRQWNIDYPVFGMISNFQDLETSEYSDVAWPEFRPFLADLPEQIPSHGLGIGFMWGLDRQAMQELVLEAPNLRTRAVAARLTRLVHCASAHPSGVIGGQVSSLTIPRKFASPALADYRVLSNQTSSYFVAQIDATRSPVGVVSAASITFEPLDGGAPPIIRTPLAGRNKPCPCGSRRKYKLCHSAQASTPVMIDFRAEDPNSAGGQKVLDPIELQNRQKEFDREFRRTERRLRREESRALKTMARIEQLRSERPDECPLCSNSGWVCDEHLDRPWKGNGACSCGASGAPCRVCNNPGFGQMPRGWNEPMDEYLARVGKHAIAKA
ncbi:YecA family protein [Bradyrhizobium sp. WSM3983]|uniref:YecA family protein n=1 Tax=Bradyrhizobium sp. WSM3983 TaxID=1038867 RepID=UPI0003FC19DF|nr:SEC-C domain-containing protein [Bradyrhizobium sp. WSM3983]